jgi:hypothetical protein
MAFPLQRRTIDRSSDKSSAARQAFNLNSVHCRAGMTYHPLHTTTLVVIGMQYHLQYLIHTLCLMWSISILLASGQHAVIPMTHISLHSATTVMFSHKVPHHTLQEPFLRLTVPMFRCRWHQPHPWMVCCTTIAAQDNSWTNRLWYSS